MPVPIEELVAAEAAVVQQPGGRLCDVRILLTSRRGSFGWWSAVLRLVLTLWSEMSIAACGVAVPWIGATWRATCPHAKYCYVTLWWWFLLL